MSEEFSNVEPTVTEQIFAVVCVVAGSYILYTSARSALRDRRIRKADKKFNENFLATDIQE